MAQSSLDCERVVGVDANATGDAQGLLNDLARRELRMAHQRPRCRQGKSASGANRDDLVIGLDYLARPADKQHLRGIHHNEHRLQVAEVAVGTPLLCQLNCSPKQVSTSALQLLLEAPEQGHRIRNTAGKPRQDALIVQPPYLARMLLEHGVVEGHLPIRS
jgi:hypothetical protein